MASDIGPGSFVECVLTFNNLEPEEALPTVGRVYTVRETTVLAGDPGVRLVEIINPPLDYGIFGVVECAYHIRHFRPIDPRALDSIRNAIRTPEEVG